MTIIRVTDRKLIDDKYKRGNVAINMGYKGHCKAQAEIIIKKMAQVSNEPGQILKELGNCPVCVLCTFQLCLTLCNRMDCSPPGTRP